MAGEWIRSPHRDRCGVSGMTRAGCRSVFACLASLVALLAPVYVVRADDTEQRDYSVFIDGKEAGMSRMTLIQKNDGTTYMTATLEVKFRHLVVVDYVIKAETQEWWKDGRLIGMKTSSSENSKKSEVTIAADNKQLRMRANGKESMLNADVWTNSYWKLADGRFHNNKVPIVEVDSGKEYTTDLKYIGVEKIKTGDQFLDCYRFLVMSAPGPIDLWFDKYHRLVRQEFTESGHKTIVQLLNVRR
jgi:hypothetical protein